MTDHEQMTPVKVSAEAPQIQHKQSRPNVVLPWVTTAILAVLSIVLVVMYVIQSNKLSDVQQKLDEATASPTTPSGPQATTPSTAASPTSATTTPIRQDTTAAPSDDVTALLRSLPRRDASDPAALGSVDAPVVMIEWSDFRCPYCSRFFHETHDALLPYVESGSLRIERRDMVMFGEQSLLVAKGARAAGLQGKYWEYYEAAFTDSPTDSHMEVTLEKVLGFAKTAGVPDLEKFEADLDTDEVLEQLTRDVTEANQIGVNSVPFFVINDQVVSGAQPTDVFTQAIEQAGGHK